eukprot:CAMPEP_0179141340 /NCGR_PEP_ID=MMETSP0796-20121207/67775_1 /TAXON_ID=73915 /ORGANISM="Pyrodinium bahamense, Strain pbaha01" /LENGTH=631 /DNA_ID=CAMNT_0020841039 /DNA_START=38 /DNA_END=1933 /DNA_ORIENTATION=+
MVARGAERRTYRERAGQQRTSAPRILPSSRLKGVILSVGFCVAAAGVSLVCSSLCFAANMDQVLRAPGHPVAPRFQMVRSVPLAAPAPLLRTVLHAATEATRNTPDSSHAGLDWRAFRARLVERAKGENFTGEQAAAASEWAVSGISIDQTAAGQLRWVHTTPLIETGSVLLAKPGPSFVQWPHFHKSVVFIVEHDEGKSDMGFILNRPTPRVASFGTVDLNIWYGGPCQGINDDPSEQSFVCLHMRPDLVTDEEPIIRGVYLTSPWEAVDHVVRGRATANDFMLFVGHCGWGPGQLQSELDDGKAWRMAAVDADTLFGNIPRRNAALTQLIANRSCSALLGCGLSAWRRLYHRLSPEEVFSDGDNTVGRLADRALRAWVESELAAQAVGGGEPGSNGAEGAVDWIRGRAAEELSAEGVEEAVSIKAIAEQVLGVMAAEPGAAFTQEQGCEALRHLIMDSETRSLVASLHGIEATLKAMRAHPDEPGVQGHCSGTLTHLSGSSENQDLIVSLGGLEVVLKGLQDHLGSSLVQYKGCAVLANVAVSPAGRARVASLGGIDAALHALELYPDEVAVQEYCCGALLNLAQNEENRASISALGGIDVAWRAVKEHPEAADLQKVGLDLLAILLHG